MNSSVCKEPSTSLTMVSRKSAEVLEWMQVNCIFGCRELSQELN